MAGYVGTIGGASNTTFANTLGWNTTAAVAAGDHVVIVCYVSSGPVDISSVSVGALSLTRDARTGAGFPELETWSAPAPSGLSSGVAVLITFDDSFNGKTAVGEVLTGIASSSYVRATGTSQDTGTACPSGTTDTSPLTGDLAFASCAALTPATDINSVSGGYTLGGANGADPWGLSVGGAAQAAYLVLAAGGAASTTFTLSASDNNRGNMVVYKAASGAAPQTLRPDADIVTTGWATAPLFSKINESSPDGTVITATAS